MTTELPDEPKSRKEQYLADIAGQDVALPAEPKSREEQYLAYIAENGSGGGGGGTSITVVQTTGSSTTDVMSQKAVTDIIGNIETALNAINNGTGV